jgi:hypothetical protein
MLLSFINQHALQVFVCKSTPDKCLSTVTAELSPLPLFIKLHLFEVNQVHSSGTYGSEKHTTALLLFFRLSLCISYSLHSGVMLFIFPTLAGGNCNPTLPIDPEDLCFKFINQQN